MEWLLFSLGGFIVGGAIGVAIGLCLKPGKESVDKGAIVKATKDLDKGSTDLKKEVDKHHLIIKKNKPNAKRN